MTFIVKNAAAHEVRDASPQQRESFVNRLSKKIRDVASNVFLCALMLITLGVGSCLIVEILSARRALKEELTPNPVEVRDHSAAPAEDGA